MAKRKIDVFLHVDGAKEFERILHKHENELICAEIYNSFAGPCLALDKFFVTMKLDWSNGQMICLRVQADDIDVFSRFHGHSEPIFMFIIKHRITQVLRGVNAIKFAEIAKKEIHYFTTEYPLEDRKTYALDEATAEEKAWAASLSRELEVEAAARAACRAARQAARKRHRAELLVPHLEKLNFVLFWPHCKHAHPELYEQWDLNGIIMVGREEPQLPAPLAADVLYAADAPLSQAALLALAAAPALAICFRLLQDDTHFVSLVRRILYEDLPVLDDTKPVSSQPPRMTAFDRYKTYSKSKEQILKERKQEKENRKMEKQERRARRLSEMQRLARQKVLDSLQRRHQAREHRKLELLRTGQLDELNRFNAEPEDNEVSIVIPEELEEASEEESSEEEDPTEYFPPAGQLVPGFYSPPNDVAKANGLAVLFPKLVKERVEPLAEFLPPHVVVIVAISRRHKVIDAMQKHKNSILHMGVFKGDCPYSAQHVSYSVKQFDAMNIEEELDQYKLAFNVSVERDTALLELMEACPLRVSRDEESGEEDAHALFPHHYASSHQDLEDFP